MGNPQAIRATATLFALVALLLAPTAASGEVVPRLADLEARASSPYEFDQVGKRCATTTASRDTSLAYSGSASLKVHVQDSECSSAYARGIFTANSSRHLVEGDDFWFGAAVYLPNGFYAAHNDYTDLLRVDSYVNDNGSSVPYADRAEINFASWGSDSFYVRAARGGTARNLIGPISPSALSEGAWHWIEIHVKLGSTSGAAYTELKVDGRTLGSSKAANLFAGAAPFNRLRYGIVSTSSEGSGNLTAYFDRASLGAAELGPLSPAPPEEPQPPAPETGDTPPLVSFWPLDERSGTTAADATGTAPGTYVNGPTLGVPGIAAGGAGTAVSFDGVDDYVAIKPVPALDLTNAITVEAWCKVDALAGSVLQRFEAYELRPQANGGLAWRIWVNGALNMVVSKAETVSLGKVHQFVGTYDGSTMTLYLDGDPLGSRAVSGPMTHGAPTLDIGRNGHASTYFDGEIDDVSIFSGALSAATVLERFQHGPS